MTILSILIYIVIGSFAGVVSGLLGVGGGLVVVPSLLLTFQYLEFPSNILMQEAVATSLGAMVFTSASSTWAHYKRKGISESLFWEFAPGIIIGAISGAVFASYIPSKQLAIIFGGFSLFTGIYFLFPRLFPKVRPVSLPESFLPLLGLIIGAISAILGIGGGIMTVPVFTALQIPLRNAISTSAALGFLIAIAGVSSFLYFGMPHQALSGSIGYLYVPAFICIGISSFLTAGWGVKLAFILPQGTLQSIFGIYLIIVGFSMTYHAI